MRSENSDTGRPSSGLRNLGALIVANVLILVVLLVFVEGAARVFKLAKSCFDTCQYNYLGNPPTIHSADTTNLNLHKFDATLGYLPREGFDKTFGKEPFPSWSGSRLTILGRGIRANDNAGVQLTDAAPVVVAGDSFTYGEHVSNNQTWPSCLERRIQRPVHNGGVSGYGAAQALRRLELLVADKSVPAAGAAIWSVLVGDDFGRDQYVYIFGRPSPAVIGSAVENLKYDDPPDPTVAGSIFTTHPASWSDRAIAFLANNSWLFRAAAMRLDLLENYMRLRKEPHKNPAAKDHIIEWSIQRLAKLTIPKLLVLQYWKVPSKAALSERALILKLAKKYGVPVVDTYDVLTKNQSTIDDLYTGPRNASGGHHTAAGNELVCKQIASGLQAELNK